MWPLGYELEKLKQNCHYICFFPLKVLPFNIALLHMIMTTAKRDDEEKYQGPTYNMRFHKNKLYCLSPQVAQA